MIKYMFRMILVFLLPQVVFANNDDFISFIEKVQEYDPSIKEENIKKISDSGLYKIKTQNSNTIYVDGDFKYIFVGKIFSIKDRKILNEEKINLSSKNLNFLMEREKYFISYKNKENVKDIYVLVDYTCPFCYKLHSDINDIVNNKGINVHYLPIGRDARNKEVLIGLINIWCSKNRKEKIGEAFETKRVSGSLKECKSLDEYKSLLKDIYRFADENEMDGTPAIFNQNGLFLSGGYNNKENFIFKLNSTLE